MINRLLEKLAHWYYLNYIKPLVDADLKARLAQDAMPRKRWVGEP
jgi:hypothetical protein